MIDPVDPLPMQLQILRLASHTWRTCSMSMRGTAQDILTSGPRLVTWPAKMTNPVEMGANRSVPDSPGHISAGQRTRIDGTVVSFSFSIVALRAERRLPPRSVRARVGLLILRLQFFDTQA